MRISLQPAFILHHRPYRETSVILDVLTPNHGRVALVAKGVRSSRSKWRALLQLFSPIWLSWQGQSDLMTLTATEPAGVPIHLQGNCLLSGFYLNELLVRLLQKHDPHPQLYINYQATLLELQHTSAPQKLLRIFEKKLLEELGYGLQLTTSFQADQFYRFYPEHGFEPCTAEASEGAFLGKNLLALANEQLDDVEALREAKRLMRFVLARLLGTNELQSRKLFRGVITT